MAFFYIPGTVLLAFGLVFLMNVITGDWNAWAYAWLLLLAGAGLGTLLAGRALDWRQSIRVGATIVTLVSITLFPLFGAIARGAFIQLAAPVLLAAAGVALYRLRPERFLRSQAASDSLAASETAGGAALPEMLSARELEVLRLIDQGLSNQQIAERLTVAQSTVKTHINNIYGKLGVQNRIQAVKRARDLKIL
jgi:LuxR family maltose regulon positive regulatory protein